MQNPPPILTFLGGPPQENENSRRQALIFDFIFVSSENGRLYLGLERSIPLYRSRRYIYRSGITTIHKKYKPKTELPSRSGSKVHHHALLLDFLCDQISNGRDNRVGALLLVRHFCYELCPFYVCRYILR